MAAMLISGFPKAKFTYEDALNQLRSKSTNRKAYFSRLRRKGAEDTNSEQSESKIFAEDTDLDQRESKNSN